MAQLPERTPVRDVDVMRALAHPLRRALLNYLMSVGPRTASECAVAVDASPSNCSWHLRQLNGWGLVEPGETASGRERPWRATHVGLAFDATERDDAAGRSARLAAAGAALADDQMLTQRFLDTMDEHGPQWRAASTTNQYGLMISPAELTELNAAIDALVRPYVRMIRAAAPSELPPDARPVHASWRAVLRVEADGKPSR